MIIKIITVASFAGTSLPYGCGLKTVEAVVRGQSRAIAGNRSL